MICVLALVVFAVLGIFSASHRSLAKEAFDCVFKKITFRRCTTGFDKKIKSQITGLFMRKSPRAAGFVYKYFEVISGVFVILLIVSLFFSAQGIYNYAVYGNCNGPHDDSFCIFNPLGTDEVSCGSQHCAEEGCDCGEAEVLCTAENNFSACEGDCECNENVCG